MLAIFALVFTVNAEYKLAYDYEFTKTAFSATGETKALASVTPNLSLNWVLTTDGDYFGYDNAKGQQIGSSKNPAKSISIKTTEYTGSLSKIVLNISGASDIKATCSVSVNDTQIGSSYTLTKTASDVTFAPEAIINSVSNIEISLVQTSSKGIYIKSIQIYNGEEELIALPVVSLESGYYYENQTVTLSHPKNADMYYTLDGTTPTTASTKYTAPISITKTTDLQVIANDGKNTSEVVKANYKLYIVDLEKLDPQNIKKGAYVIAYNYEGKSYLMKNELDGYYPKATAFDLTTNETPAYEYQFVINQTANGGYAIFDRKNEKYVTLVQSGSYVNIKFNQTESASDWTFTATSNGAIKAAYGEMTKYLSFSDYYKNFTLDTKESTFPTFYLIEAGVTTGIEETLVDENSPVEYFNLQGVKVANPENGIFIKRQGSRTSKVVL